MRLDRLLSYAGDFTRSEAKNLIRQKRVSTDQGLLCAVDAEIPDGQILYLDGRPLDTRLEYFLMLNKPKGVLTAARDARQKTVLDLLPGRFQKLRCMPVGRLDKDTEGLLLFTNNGQLAHLLLSPKREVVKTYFVRVEGRILPQTVVAFREGIVCSDFTALPAELQIEQAGDSDSTAFVSVTEGKYHQIKRMFGALDFPVLELKRLSFGPLQLDPCLSPGEFRELNIIEIDALKKAVS